jgi:outer membrane protein assembly factor BamB
MTRRDLLAMLGMGLAAPTVGRAQLSFTPDLLPSRTALDRVGLERHWAAVVPVSGPAERLLLISLATTKLDAEKDRTWIFAQTSHSRLHAYDGETGRYLWGVRLGHPGLTALPVSVNADSAFVTSNQTLFCLNRETGDIRWTAPLQTFAASPTAADEEHAVVGLTNGMLSGFSVRDHRDDPAESNNRRVSPGTNLFNWKSDGLVTGRPILADRVVALGSADKRVYVAQLNPPKLVYRFRTGGPITASMGALGERTLLVPCEDNNLYAIDLYSGELKWTFSSGYPIDQQPLISGNAIYVINSEGRLSSIHQDDGTERWPSVNTPKDRLLGISPTRIYLATRDNDLTAVERSTGKVVLESRDSFERAGLNLRSYEPGLTNRFNDRLYFSSRSGFVLCLRETGQVNPNWLRDPASVPDFGVVSPKPPETPAAPDAPGSDSDAPPADDPATAFFGGFRPRGG